MKAIQLVNTMHAGGFSMTRRDIISSIIGAVIALLAVMAWHETGRSIVSGAQAQQEPAAEHERFLLLAISDAIASVAVDGERTAMVVNDASDQIEALHEHLRNLEKRMTELERKR